MRRPPLLVHRDRSAGLAYLDDLLEARPTEPVGILAEHEGVVDVLEGEHGRVVVVLGEDRQRSAHVLPLGAYRLVRDGDRVTAGQLLTDGFPAPADALAILGRDEASRQLAEEIQYVYAHNGLPLDARHVELIVRLMLAKLRVDDPGDADLTPGDLIDRAAFEELCQTLQQAGQWQPSAHPSALGLTEAGANADSFLAAAFAGNASRRLAEAPLAGQVDRLHSPLAQAHVGRLAPVRVPATADTPPAHDAGQTDAPPLAPFLLSDLDIGEDDGS
jgi:DNA-directed RNA polymerase subunit beta'